MSTLTSTREALAGTNGTPLPQTQTPDLPLPGPGKLLLACGRSGSIRFLPDGKRLLLACGKSGTAWILSAKPSRSRSNRHWKRILRARGCCGQCAQRAAARLEERVRGGSEKKPSDDHIAGA